MRVLVFTSMYPSKDAPDFAPFMADQVNSLRAAGADVDLFEFNPRRRRLNYALVIPRLARKLRFEQYDVVHTHHTYTYMMVDLARIMARSRTPVVLTNHEGEATDIERRAQTLHPTSFLRHSLLLKRYVARRADFVIFVSQRVSQVISQDGLHEVIPCGVDMQKFRPLDRAWCREQLRIPSGAFVLFFPGHVKSRAKRFELAKASYDIVQRRLPSTVLLAGGSIPHARMPLYYNAADVVLQSSYYEASPTAVKEALACEAPLVSTDVGDTRRVVTGVPHCFICSDDPLELAEHALMCRGGRAIRGRERLLALGLGLDQVAQKLLRVYQQVLSQ